MSVATSIIEATTKKEDKMEIGTLTNYNETTGDLEAVESNHPVLLQLKNQISLLEAEKDRLTEQNKRYANKYLTAQESLESLLKELLDEDDIHFDNAKKIADIFDNVSLTKQIEVSYTISAVATIEVPCGADPDDVAGSTYVERIEFYTDFDGADVVESDHDTEDWNVR